MKRVFLSILLCIAALTAVAADFNGKFKGKIDDEETIVELVQKGDSITGKVTTVGEDDSLKLVAKAIGDTFVGTLDFPGEGKLYVRGKLTGDKLSVEVAMDDKFTETEKAEFTRVSGASGLGSIGIGDTDEDEKKLTTPIPMKGATETLKSGQVYQHSSGGKFHVPQGWKVKDSEGFLQLLPPDAGQDELYGVLTEGSQGATDPMSREVVQAVDGQVTAVFPGAKRIAEPARVNAGVGKGALLIYEATQNGEVKQLRAYLTMFSGKAVTLFGVGPKAKVIKRDAALREIFATLGWGQGKTNPGLVGTWMYYGYVGATTGGGVTGGRETKIIVQLRGDGTFTYQTNSESSYNTNAGAHYNRDGDGWKGRWTATGSELVLHFEDGTSETFSYRIVQQGSATVLVVRNINGGKEMEFARQ